MTTRRSTRTTRLLARFAVTGALSLGLAGGVASAAGAAPPPVDATRAQVAPVERPGPADLAVDPDPTGPTDPTEPTEPTEPEPSCHEDPQLCEPDPCDPKHLRLPPECRPNPCDRPAHDEPERCRPDPCRDRRHGRPERPEPCRPEPCADGGDPSPRSLAPRPDRERCPEHPPCAADCDRPVPGKPNFTG